MKSVALHNLGCKVNGYEMDVMQQMLEDRGYQVVPFDKKADIYIVNTCTVTNIADRKSRQMLHGLKDCRMLDLRRNQMPSRTAVGSGASPDRKVIGLGASRGKENFLLVSLQVFRNGLRGITDIPFRLHSLSVQTGGIAVILAHNLFHELCHFVKAPGRGRII